MSSYDTARRAWSHSLPQPRHRRVFIFTCLDSITAFFCCHVVFVSHQENSLETQTGWKSGRPWECSQRRNGFNPCCQRTTRKSILEFVGPQKVSHLERYSSSNRKGNVAHLQEVYSAFLGGIARSETSRFHEVEDS